MGKSLGHTVLAEGVETPEQRDYLLAQSCAEGQGYLFSRPVAAAAFGSLLLLGELSDLSSIEAGNLEWRLVASTRLGWCHLSDYQRR